MTIRYVFCDEPAPLLATAAGEPVIPVRGDAEFATIARIAGLSGQALQAESGVVCAPAPSGDACVVGLGRDAWPAAQLYAHLTGRSVLPLEASCDLARLAGAAVVLTCAPNISYPLLETLYQPVGARTAVPGLLVAQDADDLLRVAKRSAAAFRAKAKAATRNILYLVDKLSGEPFGSAPSLDSTAPVSDVVDSLQRADAISMLFAHSTGFDISLNRGAHLCPFPDGRAPDFAQAPLCIESGICTRSRRMLPRAEAWTSGMLVDFARLRAGVLVVFGCGVVDVTNVEMNPLYNLAVPLLEQADIGACITTWRPEHLEHPSQLNALLNDLAGGVSAGQAVARFNDSDAADRTGLRLCLLGDPGVRLLPGGLERLPDPVVERRSAPRPVDPDWGAFEALKQQICNFAASSLPVQPLPISAAACGSAMPGTASDRSLLDILSGWPWLDEILLPFGRAAGEMFHEPCFHCGQPSRAYVLEFAADIEPFIASRCRACDASAVRLQSLQHRVSFARLDEAIVDAVLGEADDVSVVFIPATLRVHPAKWNLFPKQRTDLKRERRAGGTTALHVAGPLPPGPLRCHVSLAGPRMLGIWGVNCRAKTNLQPPIRSGAAHV